MKTILLIFFLVINFNSYSQTAKWHNDRAIAFYHNGEIASAIAEWTSVINIDPKYPDAYYNRANRKLELGDYKDAILDFTKAIEIDPTALAYGFRADAKFKLGDFNSAISDYTIAIDFKPWDPSRYYGYRGMCKFKLGQNESGCADLRKAGELGATGAYDLIKKYCQ